jgi:outer membrane immunogenic protein
MRFTGRFSDYGAIFAICLSMNLTMRPVAAADLGRPAAPSVTTYYGPAAYNWGGFYAGGFIGGAHGVETVDFFRNNNHGHAVLGADGFAGGAWVGYNYHVASNWVVGIEADLGRTNASQANDIFDNDTSLTRYGMFGSVRGRIGYSMDRLLVYGTAGMAFATITNTIQKGRNAGEEIVWEDKSNTGYVIGGGLEYAFSDRWMARAEYLYANYGMVTLYNRDGNRADLQNEMHQLRVGASYRF